jgi:hypothetical protein
LRSEFIAVLSTALRGGKVDMNEITLLWEELKHIPIGSLNQYLKTIKIFGTHPLSLLLGLQMLCQSLKLGDCKSSPEVLFALVINSRNEAIERMQNFSALSVKNFFKYYQRKIPKDAKYLTDDFLDEVIKFV